MRSFVESAACPVWRPANLKLVETTDMGIMSWRKGAFADRTRRLVFPVYVLKPKQQDAMRRCLIAAHGHDSGLWKICSYGPHGYSSGKKTNRTLQLRLDGVELVRRGYKTPGVLPRCARLWRKTRSGPPGRRRRGHDPQHLQPADGTVWQFVWGCRLAECGYGTCSG